MEEVEEEYLGKAENRDSRHQTNIEWKPQKQRVFEDRLVVKPLARM